MNIKNNEVPKGGSDVKQVIDAIVLLKNKERKEAKGGKQEVKADLEGIVQKLVRKQSKKE